MFELDHATKLATKGAFEIIDNSRKYMLITLIEALGNVVDSN